MKPRRLAALVFAGALAIGLPTRAGAASAVFDGDPTDPGSGQPFEILPGQPLVRPGADGRLGTADDVIDRGLVGDIDLVVRLGAVAADGTIPPPAMTRKALVTATAGLRGIGTPIPFHVYLSDGALASKRPYGALLAAADMTGLPVIVTLFADRNGDQAIGPTGEDPHLDVRALTELEPVGTEVALFDATGRASGTIMATVGGPQSQRGVTLVATAMAFTGPYDPAFFDGTVPTGPGITTAQPFLPERDPARIFTDVGPLDVGGTLNPRVRAAAIPDPRGTLNLALSIKKSSPTTDTALAVSGPAVCARVVEPGRGKGLPSEPSALLLGTDKLAGRLKLAVVAVDRFGNPTDPAPGMIARLVTDAPLALTPDRDADAASELIPIGRARGEKLTVRVLGAGAGSLRVSVGGALCQRLAVDLRPDRNRNASDAAVALKGRADFRSLAAAAAGAVDRNGDGRLTVTVGEGIFREAVSLTRAIELIGAGSGRTIVDAQGLGAALTIASPGAEVSGLTASGGTTGIAVDVPTTITGLEARGNVGAGITLAIGGAEATACIARENGGAGFQLTAPAIVTANTAIDNAGAGIMSTGAGTTISANVLTLNTGEGVLILNGSAPVITGNAIGGNFGEGISLEETTGGTVTGNRAAGNDGDGLSLNQSDGAVIDGNDFSANHGHGMRIDRATADFDAGPGTQPPPGNNDVSDSRRGDIDFR